MKKKNRLLKVGLLLAFLFAFGTSQNMFAVPRTFTGLGNWSDNTKWTGHVLPTAGDAVTISGTCTIDGNHASYSIQSLTVSSGSLTVAATDTVALNIVGATGVSADINVGATELLDCYNVDGRLNITIGDGSVGKSSLITAGAAYNATHGIRFHNLTVNQAAVTYTGAGVNIDQTGNLNIIGLSTFLNTNSNDSWRFVSTALDGQTLTADPTLSAVRFANIGVPASAKLETSANLEIDGTLTVGGTFRGLSSGSHESTVTFNNPGAANLFANTGTLEFYNVVFNAATFAQTTTGSYTVKGNYELDGTTGSLAPVTPATEILTFTNTSQRYIYNNTGTAASLQLPAIQISPSSVVKTESDFYIVANNAALGLETIANGKFIADNGTITFTGGLLTDLDLGYATITNSALGTIEFYNVSFGIATAVYAEGTPPTPLRAVKNFTTTSDFVVKGIFTLQDGSGANGTDPKFTAKNGTITFRNEAVKKIVSDIATSRSAPLLPEVTDLTFFKIMVPDGANLTVDATNGFTIASSASYSTGAGIEVQGTGSFDADATSEVNLANNNVAADYKTIKKSTNGTLAFGLLSFANSAHNNITKTSSGMTVKGATFALLGSTAFFEATADTVHFTGATPTIISPTATANCIFKHLNIANAAAAATLGATNFIAIKGNLIIDGANATFATPGDATVEFNGSSLQRITGTSAAAYPFAAGILTLNKTTTPTGADSANVLLLEKNVDLQSNAVSKINLTSGVLALGSKTLRNAMNVVFGAGTGKIDGGTGTYIINTGHVTPSLQNSYFQITRDGKTYNTLYNLTVGAAHALAGDLDVQGNLVLSTGAFDVAGNNLSVYGNLSRATGIFAASTGRVILRGSGSTTSLANAYWGAATTTNLTIARAESLTGDLAIGANLNLTIETGVSNFDIKTNTLDVSTSHTATLTRLSGGIKAETGTVMLYSNTTVLPANLFVDNTVGTLTLAGGITLGGDLTIANTLNGTISNITTGDNTLTFGPSSTYPTFFSATAHVIGNLKRTVGNLTAAKFDVGNGTATTYRPLELKFFSVGSSQVIKVSSSACEPTAAKAGNYDNSINNQWTISQEGTTPSDSLSIKFGWDDAENGSVPTSLTQSQIFFAKWNNNQWNDYRNSIGTITDHTTGTPNYLPSNGSPINAADLSGTWSIFQASNSATCGISPAPTISQMEDLAIANNKKKLVITKIENTPCQVNKPFKVTVQLQDQYGQPFAATEALSIKLGIAYDASAAVTLDGTLTKTLAIGSNSVTFSGLVAKAATPKLQLYASIDNINTDGKKQTYIPTASQPFAVIATTAPTSATGITVNNVTATTVNVNWTGAGDYAILIAKAGSVLTTDEYPVNATTYNGSTIFGTGSSIGNGVVLYNGANPPSAAFTITGLAPNTQYYFYVFTYNGSAGSEYYNLNSASGNPAVATTAGTIDDDYTYGDNNTLAEAKFIGTNTPIQGTIKSVDDVDWFCFNVTNSAPNARVALYNLPANYNIELYNLNNRRIRRSLRTSSQNETAIMNNLVPGMYALKIYGVDGAYSATSTYTLKVDTKTSEIFSVTP